MSIKNFTAIFFAFCILAFANTGFAELISPGELAKNPKTYDAKSVNLQGEVVGDVMKRGQYAWLSLQANSYVFSLWCPIGLAEEIKFAGKYGIAGDRIEIAGIFNYSCPEHGGEMDVHVQELKILQKGSRLDYPRQLYKLQLAVILLLAACALFAVYKIISKMQST